MFFYRAKTVLRKLMVFGSLPQTNKAEMIVRHRVFDFVFKIFGILQIIYWDMTYENT